jgi:hypothetical protein
MRNRMNNTKKGRQIKVGIVGAGASGMTAAIAAARAGADVTVFERNDRVGKKILATGNGRCNLGNRQMSVDRYYTDNKKFVEDRLNEFGTDETVHFFESLGLMIKDKNGYLYPASEQASAVLDVLRNEMTRLGINIITECMVKSVNKKESAYVLMTEEPENADNRYMFDKVIVACGGQAAPSSGSDGNGYMIAKHFGHHIKKTVPALVQLKCQENFFKSVSGVRADANIEIWFNGKKEACERGELQITDYGISGIPIFQISRTAAYMLTEGKKPEVHIDFLPDYTENDYKEFCDKRYSLLKDKEETVGGFFTGMLNKKLMQLFIRMAGLKAEDKVKNADKSAIYKVFSLCRDLKVTVTETNGFKNAQVTAGGILLSEISEQFESLKSHGLYFTGEILDVDGICGGYNLQWAWCSGYTAGNAAAKAQK